MAFRHGISQFSAPGAAGGGTGEGVGVGLGVGLGVAMGVGAGLGDSVAPAWLDDAVTVAVGWLPAQAATLTRRAAATIGPERRRHHGVLTIPSSTVRTPATPLGDTTSRVVPFGAARDRSPIVVLAFMGGRLVEIGRASCRARG